MTRCSVNKRLWLSGLGRCLDAVYFHQESWGVSVNSSDSWKDLVPTWIRCHYFTQYILINRSTTVAQLSWEIDYFQMNLAWSIWLQACNIWWHKWCFFFCSVSNLLQGSTGLCRITGPKQTLKVTAFCWINTNEQEKCKSIADRNKSSLPCLGGARFIYCALLTISSTSVSVCSWHLIFPTFL